MEIKLHNRFDIRVEDTITGKVSEYTHYNIVLDTVYNDIFRKSSWYWYSHPTWTYYIVFGSGSGTPQKTNSTLFSPVASVRTEHVYTKYDNFKMTGEKQMCITLQPDEYVGTQITEIGIGTTTKAYTHSMIKDSYGNPIAINKTATDKIIIYATVYAEIKASGTKIVTNMHDTYNNFYIRLMLGEKFVFDYTNGPGTSLNYVHPLYYEWVPFTDTNWTEYYDSASIVDGCTIIKNVMNTSQGNGVDIRSMNIAAHDNSYGSMLWRGGFTIALASDNFEGVSYPNVSIGRGDNVTKVFDLPLECRNVKNLTVKVNNREVNNYTAKKLPGIAKCVGAKALPENLISLGNNRYIQLLNTGSSGKYQYQYRIWEVGADKFEPITPLITPELTVADSSYRYSFVLPEHQIIGFGTDADAATTPLKLYKIDFTTGELGALVGEIPRGAKTSTISYLQVVRINGTSLFATLRCGTSSTAVLSALYRIENDQIVKVSDLTSYLSGAGMPYSLGLPRGVIGGDIYTTETNAFYQFNAETQEFDRKTPSLPGKITIAPFIRAELVDHPEDASKNQLKIYHLDADYSTQDTVTFPEVFDRYSTYKGITVLRENLFIVDSPKPYIILYDPTSKKIVYRTNLSNLFGSYGADKYTHNVQVYPYSDEEFFYVYRGYMMQGEVEFAGIEFHIPPDEGDVITVDYILDYIQKNSSMTASIQAKMVWG